MKTADLISSFLNNEMTLEQERQFLLSVAASDSLRLSLKSQFMLDRIVSDQVLHAHVPEPLRASIFAQAAAVSVPAHSISSSIPSEPAAESRIARLFGRAAMMAVLVVGGYAAGYFSQASPEASGMPAANAPAVTTPAQSLPAVAPQVDPATSAAPDAEPVQAKAAQAVEPGHRVANRTATVSRPEHRVDAAPAAGVQANTEPATNATGTTVNADGSNGAEHSPQGSARFQQTITKPSKSPDQGSVTQQPRSPQTP